MLDINVRLDALGEVLGRTLESQIKVKLDLADDLWNAEVDATQLETALLNAALNARDAMPNGGCLTLSTANRTTDEGDFICVALTDTGSGMPEDVVGRAFEPFFTTKPVGKGTGLGLSQIHGFAAQSGGTATIESAPGEGTTIRILLPRSHKSPATSSTNEAQPPDQLAHLKIMLVEDNPHVLAFAEQLLHEMQLDVISASSGEEALETLNSESVDLLLTDVVMPGMSGVELAQKVRGRWPDMPVVLASGYSEEMLAGAGSEFEMLRKPFDSASVNAAIAAALRQTGNDVRSAASGS